MGQASRLPLGRFAPLFSGARRPFIAGRRPAPLFSNPGLVPRSINTSTFVASIFGSGEARRGSIPRSGAVTQEQRSQNRKATQPSGRRFFLAQTSLLTPYRLLKGMLVARASSGPKIPRRKRGRIYGMGYLGKTGVPTRESLKANQIRCRHRPACGGCRPGPTLSGQVWRWRRMAARV